ncbi:hypothetical protein U1Q18_017850 [Sarracenia purpurea var. burkii]
MADYSFLSDGSDESAVEELLSQATDHSILQQIAAINCSSFTSDSVLPTHLETRFRTLKSFPPAAKPYPPKNSSSSFNSRFPSAKSPNSQFEISAHGKPESRSLSDDEDVLSEENLKEKKDLNPKLRSGSGSSPSKSFDLASGNAILSRSKENRDGKTGSKSRLRRPRSFLPPDCSNSSMDDSPSPPKKSGCFWCSPKKASTKKNEEIQAIGGGGVDWGRNGKEFLSDLSIFSGKEQQKILKKAMKEEEKINREAEKIIKWAKQASVRIQVSDIEDELSDIENPK